MIAHDPTVAADLLKRLQTSRRLTFAEVMEVALYHPTGGYYTAHVELGPAGDFTTAPELHPAFGALLGEFVRRGWGALGSPGHFTVVEQGAGRGVLAHALLTHLATHHPACAHALRYVLVERSSRLQAQQRERLAAVGAEVAWADAVPTGFEGILLSNELVDAFPVHRVVCRGGELRELYVREGGSPLPPGERGSPLPPGERGSPLLPGERGSPLPPGERGSPLLPQRYQAPAEPREREAPAEPGESPSESRLAGEDACAPTGADGASPAQAARDRRAPQAARDRRAPSFTWEEGPLSTPALADYFVQAGVELTDGQEAEVNLAALSWMAEVATALARGLVVTIDFGHTARQLYAAARRRGTLLAYHRQQVHEEVLTGLGCQDLIAHVDFSALVTAGQAHGLQPLGLVTQSQFLQRLGIRRWLRALDAQPMRAADRRALLALVDPSAAGLGEAKVLVQAKGVESTLEGLLA